MAEPYLPFYVDVWRGDERLASVSLAARGLWLEMLGLMHRADPRGYLVVAGKRVGVKAHATIALHARTTAPEAKKLLGELADHGVYSVAADGTIYSRRMVKDTATRERARANGKRGGSPLLKGPDNPPAVKGPGVVGPDNALDKLNGRDDIASLRLDSSGQTSALEELSPGIALGVWFTTEGIAAGAIDEHHGLHPERGAYQALDVANALLETYSLGEIKTRAARFFARKTMTGPRRIAASATLEFLSRHWDWFDAAELRAVTPAVDDEDLDEYTKPSLRAVK